MANSPVDANILRDRGLSLEEIMLQTTQSIETRKLHKKSQSISSSSFMSARTDKTGFNEESSPGQDKNQMILLIAQKRERALGMHNQRVSTGAVDPTDDSPNSSTTLPPPPKSTQFSEVQTMKDEKDEMESLSAESEPSLPPEPPSPTGAEADENVEPNDNDQFKSLTEYLGISGPDFPRKQEVASVLKRMETLALEIPIKGQGQDLCDLVSQKCCDELACVSNETRWIVHVAMARRHNTGVHVRSSCWWDNERDGGLSHCFRVDAYVMFINVYDVGI
eukprot:c2800_g1_i1.p1 GENE.c2800_g1_i1~~c2800_g1_i1.p1  ORF type:complete len:278 (-),score=68.00 c2800_g1_i1:19-852(-)